MAARFPCPHQNVKRRTRNRFSAPQCFMPQFITASLQGLPHVRTPMVINLLMRKCVFNSSVYGQRRQDSPAGVYARPRLHAFHPTCPYSTPVRHITGQSASVLRTTYGDLSNMILFAVLHSSAGPESHHVVRSNCTLSSELAILLRGPTQTKQGGGCRTPSHHDPDAGLQRRVGRGFVGLASLSDRELPNIQNQGSIDRVTQACHADLRPTRWDVFHIRE